VKYRETGFLE